MASGTALLSYRGRVAQEKQRIAEYMGASTRDVRSFWEATRTTRRFALTTHDSALLWHNRKSKAAVRSLHVKSAEYKHSDVVARITIANKDTLVVDRTVDVGRYPVMIEDGLFVSVDGVEPFVTDEKGMSYLCLIVHAVAAPNGEWPSGWVVGTQEEYDIHGTVA